MGCRALHRWLVAAVVLALAVVAAGGPAGAEERLELLQAGAALSREFLRRTAWIQVFVDVNGRGDGGYYGGVTLTVGREVQVPSPAPWLNGEETAGSFRAAVYRNGYFITRGVSYGVRDLVKGRVSDLLVEFVSDFYGARPDL